MSWEERLGSAAEARWVARYVAPAEREALVDRRLAGEPLQYLLGEWAFRTLTLAVDPRALIPRPETEQVVEAALAVLRFVRRPVVVDLGTGTGAIALSVAAEVPTAEVWATDDDPAALELAAENRARTKLPVALRRGRWYGALPDDLHGRVDLVISNPPYVSEAEWPGLDPEVRREPRRALVAGAGSDGTPGLADIEVVLGEAPAWLRPRGVVVVEMAPHQAQAAVAAARAAGFSDVRVERDLAGRDRAVVARR
jgi:release factor glutamine methyltransferase